MNTLQDILLQQLQRQFSVMLSVSEASQSHNEDFSLHSQ
jgi:hypothetical protein